MATMTPLAQTQVEAQKSRPTATKSKRIEARVTEDTKAILEQAAALFGRSMTDFVIDSAVANAKRAIDENQRMTLSARDREIFVGALLKPPAPSAKARAAARRYKELTGA